MANNMRKQQWIEEVMNSTQSMGKAEAPHDLYVKITDRLNKPVKVVLISLPVKQWAAAAILLLALNVGSVVYFNSYNKKQAPPGTSVISAEMQLETTYNY